MTTDTTGGGWGWGHTPSGSFYLGIRKITDALLGYSAQLSFSIIVHKKDRAILELIQSKWAVGTVKDKSNNTIAFTVTGHNNIRVVIDHFDKYPLRTKK